MRKYAFPQKRKIRFSANTRHRKTRHTTLMVVQLTHCADSKLGWQNRSNSGTTWTVIPYTKFLQKQERMELVQITFLWRNWFLHIYLLITHEENTKKNHKRVVSLYVIEIPLICINFNFDFLDLHNVFFENYFVNELTRSNVFEAI
jgi:hypothetical protein